MASPKTGKKTAGQPARTTAAAKAPAAPRKPAAKKQAASAPAAKKQAPAGATAAKRHEGSCHCGRIAFEVEGAIDRVMDCNCSMCRRRGGLLWFVPRESLRVITPASSLWTYTFNKHALQHHFCANCGIAPFSEGESKGKAMAAVNVRCLEGIDLDGLQVVKYDGRSL